MLPACPSSWPESSHAAVPRQPCRMRLCAGKDRGPHLLLLPSNPDVLRQGEAWRRGGCRPAGRGSLFAKSLCRPLRKQYEIHHGIPGKAQVPAPRSAVAGAFGIRRLPFTRRPRNGNKPLRRTARPSAKTHSSRLKIFHLPAATVSGSRQPGDRDICVP